MSDEDGNPANKRHVFNGGSQQPRYRSNVPRTQDWTRLHARRDRMMHKKKRALLWAQICKDIQIKVAQGRNHDLC